MRYEGLTSLTEVIPPQFAGIIRERRLVTLPTADELVESGIRRHDMGLVSLNSEARNPEPNTEHEPGSRNAEV